MRLVDKTIWHFVDQCLQRQEPVALLIVVETEDSSPGRAGFKMAVAGDGVTSGTVGGGTMEFKLVNRARNMLAENTMLPVLMDQNHESGADLPSGLICGGRQRLLFCPLNNHDRPIVRRLMNDTTIGTLRITLDGIAFSPEPGVDRPTFIHTSDTAWLYEEPISIIDTAYLIGSGHVGLALSQILATLDFRLIVLDHRPDISTVKNNIYAHEKLIMPYNQFSQHILEGDHQFAVILTCSHKIDEIVLRSLIEKRLRYLGMLGSATKIKIIFDQLRADGVSAEVLRRVHAPIGLPIHSRTAEEIAVSIAAEMIQVKNSTKVIRNANKLVQR